MNKPIKKILIAIPIIILTIITHFKVWGLYFLIAIFLSGYYLAKHRFKKQT